MKAIHKLLLSGLSVITIFSTASCYSNNQTVNESTIKYTMLNDCKDTVNNVNAAYVELSCPEIAGYQVKITAQDPLYFNIILSKNSKETSTDFTTVSNDNPIEPGKAIEWHLYNNEPKFMIFRLSVGTEEKPFDMHQYLLINMVTDDQICVIDKVDVESVKNANQVARDLVANKYRDLTTCPRNQ